MREHNTARRIGTTSSANSGTPHLQEAPPPRHPAAASVIADAMEILPLLRAIKRISQQEVVDYGDLDDIWRNADEAQKAIERL